MPDLRPVKSVRSFATLRSISALILREMSTRYGNTPGGYLWAFVEPLGEILVLAIAFSFLVRSPSLGNSFILFYASGVLPFGIYRSASNMTARALNFSRPLLSYPTVTWMDAILARFLLNMLTSFLVAYVLLFSILHVTDTTAILDIVPILEAMILAALLGLGIGSVNCVIGGFYPTWEMIWSIATRPLFIISGVLFIYEDLPNSAQAIAWYNPIIHITGLMRTGVFPNYHPGYISILYVMVWVLVPLALGLLLLRRYYRDLLQR